MKILLVAVNAKYIHSNLAVYNLRECSGAFRDQVKIVEYTINEYPKDVLRKICQEKPDFVGVSCYIWNVARLEEIFSDFRKIFPHVPVFFGGPEASHQAREFLQTHPYASGVMVGEGENTFRRLLESLYGGEGPLTVVPGLLYRESLTGGREDVLVDTGAAALVDMDAIPFAYADMAPFANKIIYYESSRGCPFSCSYCLSSIDKQVRFRSMDLVKKELLFFLEHQVPQVKFVDRTFNCNRARAREIWRFLLEHDRGITNFHFEVGADLLEQEDFAIMEQMRPGLIQLEIGVQTTNPETLREIRRVCDWERLQRAVGRIRDLHNVHQHLDLIAGLPGEDFASFRTSFQQVFALKPQQLQLGFLKLLKGSLMYEKAEEYGMQYSEFPPYEVLSTRWLSFDEIIRLKGVEEMVETYYNSSQFGRSLEALLSCYENAFDFFLELSLFREERGAMEGSSSRMARYELLREFVRERHPRLEPGFSERLLFDLYAREKLKSRPAWAPEEGAYRQAIHGFYEREAASPRYLEGYEGRSPRQLKGMTHVEVFSWLDGERSAYLFDYSRRDPLTREARIIRIELK